MVGTPELLLGKPSRRGTSSLRPRSALPARESLPRGDGTKRLDDQLNYGDPVRRYCAQVAVLKSPLATHVSGLFLSHTSENHVVAA